jgi:hypothetical protein
VVFRILPHKIKAEARAEGPCGNRALPNEPEREAGEAARTETIDHLSLLNPPAFSSPAP